MSSGSGESKNSVASNNNSKKEAEDRLRSDARKADLLCPISLELMIDPVKTADGWVYDRASIESWFSAGHNTSPLTNVRLTNLKLVPDEAKLKKIKELVSRYPDTEMSKEWSKAQPGLTTVYRKAISNGLSRAINRLVSLPPVQAMSRAAGATKSILQSPLCADCARCTMEHGAGGMMGCAVGACAGCVSASGIDPDTGIRVSEPMDAASASKLTMACAACGGCIGCALGARKCGECLHEMSKNGGSRKRRKRTRKKQVRRKKRKTRRHKKRKTRQRHKKRKIRHRTRKRK